MIVLSLVISIVALIISIIAILFGIYYFIELKAMQKSTHNIQMVPVDDFGKVQTTSKTQRDFMNDDLDNIL
jgi:vancomycin permeability regulator SanA